MIRVRGSNQQKKQLFHHDLGLKGCLDKETFFSGSVDTFFLVSMGLKVGYHGSMSQWVRPTTKPTIS